jgi:P2-related tail formation protein
MPFPSLEDRISAAAPYRASLRPRILEALERTRPSLTTSLERIADALADLAVVELATGLVVEPEKVPAAADDFIAFVEHVDSGLWAAVEHCKRIASGD